MGTSVSDDIKMRVKGASAYKANGIFDCVVCFVSGYVYANTPPVFAYVKLGCCYLWIQSQLKWEGLFSLTSRDFRKRYMKTCPHIWNWFIGQVSQINSGQIALQLCHILLNGEAHWRKWRVTATPKSHCLMWRDKMIGVIASVITLGRYNISQMHHTVFLSII